MKKTLSILFLTLFCLPILGMEVQKTKQEVPLAQETKKRKSEEVETVESLENKSQKTTNTEPTEEIEQIWHRIRTIDPHASQEEYLEIVKKIVQNRLSVGDCIEQMCRHEVEKELHIFAKKLNIENDLPNIENFISEPHTD